MNKLKILIKKLKTCEKIDDNLYEYIYNLYHKENNKEFFYRIEWQEDDYENKKQFMFYRSLFINSSCLRVLYNQENYFKGFNMLYNKPIDHECTGKLLRRWYTIQDMKTSKIIRFIKNQINNRNSYFYYLSKDLIKLICNYL